MKLKLATIAASLVLASCLWTTAAETAQRSSGSSNFDRLKTLVGTWKGQADMGQGPIDMTVRFRLLAGGTVLEERVFEGTPNEMVTMYYEKDGQLALTHYCVMGNRPAMFLTGATAKTLTFDFDKTCGINTAKESHMHSLTIQFDDADTVTTSCKAFLDGKEMPDHPTTLRRVKNS